MVASEKGSAYRGRPSSPSTSQQEPRLNSKYGGRQSRDGVSKTLSARGGTETPCHFTNRGVAKWEGSGLISRLRAGSIPAPAIRRASLRSACSWPAAGCNSKECLSRMTRVEWPRACRGARLSFISSSSAQGHCMSVARMMPKTDLSGIPLVMHVARRPGIHRQSFYSLKYTSHSSPHGDEKHNSNAGHSRRSRR